MPANVIASYAEKANKPIEEVEKLWDEVKAYAAKKFRKKDSHYWAYVNAVVAARLGLKKEQVSFGDFVKMVQEVEEAERHEEDRF